MNGHLSVRNGIQTETIINGTSHEHLKVIVVGGGIAGLSAAIALRKQGHHVEVYEQSRFANEVGAAIHMTPNATGALQHVGINPKDAGAVRLEISRFFSAQNEPLRVVPNKDAHRWQNEWVLAHRAHLHNQLKAAAMAEDGDLKPVKLITSSQVLSVDAKTATITLADGSSHSGDVLIGADGVHSNVRNGLGQGDYRPFKGKHNAFRFTMSRAIPLADIDTQGLVNLEGAMDLWYSEHLKIVVYPTSYNKLLNFVCIHPAELSESSNDYQKAASKELMLEIFSGFHPRLVKLLSMVDPAELKIYPLYDMAVLPTYVNGRLALIGDAAHPFTPHIAQGGAMAIEDGLSLGVMLDKDVTPEEVPERLRLYNRARYERSSRVQEYSRIVGGDGTDQKSEQGQKLKVHEYLEWPFSHNEFHASTQLLRDFKWQSLKATPQRSVFGPLPSRHQSLNGSQYLESLRRTDVTKITITFKTSATILRNLFPNTQYSFEKRDTVAVASFSIESYRNVSWLAGGGYDTLKLGLHGVEYNGKAGRSEKGTYVPLLVDNLPDSTPNNEEEHSLPKLFSDIDVSMSRRIVNASVSWRGAQWADLEMTGLSEQEAVPAEVSPNSERESVFMHKYGSDTESDVLVSTQSETAEVISRGVSTPEHCRVSINNLGQRKLPTLYPVVERLAEIPIFEIVSGEVIEYQGMIDVVVKRLG